MNIVENKGKIFVVRPPEVLKIGRLEKNRDKIQKVYFLTSQNNNWLRKLLKYPL